MKKVILFSLILSLSSSIAAANGISFMVINKALVTNKLMPVGSEVKIKVVEISDQFAANIKIVSVVESAFNPGSPSETWTGVKSWNAQDLQKGDVLNYTTTSRGFIGFTAGTDYRDLYIDQLENSYRLTMDFKKHRWVLDVKFPDYDF